MNNQMEIEDMLKVSNNLFTAHQVKRIVIAAITACNDEWCDQTRCAEIDDIEVDLAAVSDCAEAVALEAAHDAMAKEMGR